MLEMHQAPKMLLYNPLNPTQNNDDHLIPHNFFFQITEKDPTSKFITNIKVAILLVMSNVQFQNILMYKATVARQEKTNKTIKYKEKDNKDLVTNKLIDKV